MNLKIVNYSMTMCLIIFWSSISISLQAQQAGVRYPFSTNKSELTIWNGSEYVPFFIKGINLGIAKPGTFPENWQPQKKTICGGFHK